VTIIPKRLQEVAHNLNIKQVTWLKRRYYFTSL